MVEERKQSAEVLTTDSPREFQAAVRAAADLLRRGEVVAVPTETVYGLAANALNAAAVQRIFEVKGRPAHNPLIVHVSGVEMARRCVVDFSEIARKLADAFWPGPLTLVMPRASIIPDVVTAAGDTVGIRWPRHSFVQALIQQCGFPLAAPSANLSNRVSPTTAAHVKRQLGARIRLIVDGGQSQVGIESTVLDISRLPPRVLRPGMIHEAALLAVTGKLANPGGDQGSILKSPGLLKKHYAPRARLVVLHWRDDSDLRRRAADSGVRPEHVFVISHTNIPSGQGWGRVSVIPHDAEAFARAIYGELHACDEAGAELIVIEALPSGVEWKAVVDRLNRAAEPPS